MRTSEGGRTMLISGLWRIRGYRAGFSCYKATGQNLVFLQPENSSSCELFANYLRTMAL